MIAAEGLGVMPPAQLDEQLLPRLVLQPLEILEGEGLDRVHLLFRQVRPAQDVGIEAQGRGEVSAQRRPPKADVQCADALMTIEAQVIEGKGQLPAIAVAGAAGDEVG